MPDAKKAFALSSLRFSNGSTAIDFSGVGRDAALRRPSSSVLDWTARRSVPTIRRRRKPRVAAEMTTPAMSRYFRLLGNVLAVETAAATGARENFSGTAGL